MTTPIPKATRAAVIADCLSGMAQIAAARKNGISGASVYRILRDANVQLEKRDMVAVMAAAVTDYVESGHSSRTVARRHDISDDSLRAELKRRGEMRKQGGARPNRIRQAAVADIRAGKSVTEVANLHGLSRSSVSAWADQEGLVIEKRGGGSIAYAGGWVQRGWIQVPLVPERRAS